MTKYLLLGLSLALVSCASTKPLPHYTPAQQAAQRASIGYWQLEPAKRDSFSGPRVEPNSQLDFIKRIFAGKAPVVQQDIPGDYIATPDSLRFVKVERQPSWLKRLFPAKSKTVPNIHAGDLPRKCKGCTFLIGDNNTVAGKKATVAAGDGAAVVVTGKKAGPVVLADSGAVVKLATSTTGQAAAGEGISQEHEETEQSLFAPVVLAGLGTIAGVGLVYWLVAGGGALWVVGLFKRRNAETQA